MTIGAALVASITFLKGFIMKIKCLRNVVIGGDHYDAGDVADVSIEVGTRLINMGKAQPHEEEPKAKKDRSVGLTTKSAAGLLKRAKKAK